jgi:hypothetical protein
MHDDVRLAALRAASKLALGVTFVGCSAPAPADPSAAALESDGYPAATEDDELRRARHDAGAARCRDAGREAAPATPAASCKEVVACAFAGAAWDPLRTYRSEKAPVPAVAARVKECCLPPAGEQSFLQPEAVGEHRWECCNLIGGGISTGEGTPAYCTPWGPPVPPVMRTARRSRRGEVV